MKVLILSCNTGQGHNAAGKALKEEFLKRGAECKMLDAREHEIVFFCVHTQTPSISSSNKSRLKDFYSLQIQVTPSGNSCEISTL